jgi:hypothetical protein
MLKESHGRSIRAAWSKFHIVVAKCEIDVWECRIRFLECEWKVQFDEEIWREIVRGVTEPDIHEAKDATKISAAHDNVSDDEDSCDKEDDSDGDRDDLVRPVNVTEDNKFHAVFHKLFGVLKEAFMAATKDVMIPYVSESGNMTRNSLKSRIQTEWDMDSIVGEYNHVV